MSRDNLYELTFHSRQDYMEFGLKDGLHFLHRMLSLLETSGSDVPELALTYSYARTFAVYHGDAQIAEHFARSELLWRKIGWGEDNQHVADLKQRFPGLSPENMESQLRGVDGSGRSSEEQAFDD